MDGMFGWRIRDSRSARCPLYLTLCSLLGFFTHASFFYGFFLVIYPLRATGLCAVCRLVEKWDTTTFIERALGELDKRAGFVHDCWQTRTM